MAGNKNSGRPPKWKETLEKEAVIKAWEKLTEKLENLDMKDVRDIALPLALKSMKEFKDLTSGGKPIILPSEVIEKNKDD